MTLESAAALVLPESSPTPPRIAPDALARVVQLVHPRLVAVARRILRDEDEACDVVQEACLLALRGLPGFEARAKPSTWLHRIVVNAALMRCRARRRRPEAPFDDGLPEGSGPPVQGAVAESAEESAARRQVRAHVRRAIAALPERHRTVLVLRDLHELDTDEAAHALGLGRNALKIRLHRARQALRRALATDAG